MTVLDDIFPEFIPSLLIHPPSSSLPYPYVWNLIPSISFFFLLRISDFSFRHGQCNPPRDVVDVQVRGLSHIFGIETRRVSRRISTPQTPATIFQILKLYGILVNSFRYFHRSSFDRGKLIASANLHPSILELNSVLPFPPFGSWSLSASCGLSSFSSFLLLYLCFCSLDVTSLQHSFLFAPLRGRLILSFVRSIYSFFSFNPFSLVSNPIFRLGEIGRFFTSQLLRYLTLYPSRSL